MIRLSYMLAGCAAAALIGWAASRPDDILFERQMIDAGASEAVAVADMDGDGRADIVSGEFWYQAPRWTKHRFRQIDFTNNYVDNFSDLALDVNRSEERRVGKECRSRWS